MTYDKYIYGDAIDFNEVVNTHLEILEAIERRDEDRAERAMVAHIMDVGQRVILGMKRSTDLPLD
jgi:DNA-binding GntR family transcriptional regulator